MYSTLSESWTHEYHSTVPFGLLLLFTSTTDGVDVSVLITTDAIELLLFVSCDVDKSLRFYWCNFPG